LFRFCHDSCANAISLRMKQTSSNSGICFVLVGVLIRKKTCWNSQNGLFIIVESRSAANIEAGQGSLLDWPCNGLLQWKGYCLLLVFAYRRKAASRTSTGGKKVERTTYGKVAWEGRTSRKWPHVKGMKYERAGIGFCQLKPPRYQIITRWILFSSGFTMSLWVTCTEGIIRSSTRLVLG